MTEIILSGIGLVCPAGLNVAAAIGSNFKVEYNKDENRYPFHSALPRVFSVPDEFSLKGIIKKRKNIKLMARANQFAVAAAHEAVSDADLNLDLLSEAGLYLAVGREPSDLKALLPSVAHSVQDGVLDLETLFGKGVDWINPLSSLKTLPNMSLAHVAIHLGCRGPNMSLFGPEAFHQSLDAAKSALLAGKCQVAIVGAADSCTSFYDRLGVAREQLADAVGEGAALFVLETETHFKARRGKVHYPIASLWRAWSEETLGFSGAATPAIQAAIHCASHRTEAALPSKEIVAIKQSRREVVVTGIGLVSPLGTSFEEFSKNIRNGKSAVGAISQFDASHFTVKNVCEVNRDDWWFRMPEALRNSLSVVNERSAKFAVSAALEALRDAELTDTPDSLIYGTGLSSVSIQELTQDCLPYLKAGSSQLKFDEVIVERRGINFVSPHRHRMTLPLEILQSHWGKNVETIVHFSACAAGAAAIGHGMELIRSGKRDMVLVGAADAMIHPYGLIPFAKLGATSTRVNPNDAAKPFDRDRSGFVMGETSAFYVLESAERAERRGRRGYGRILGWGSSCDAHNVTAPHPDGLGAVIAMKNALLDAQIGTQDVDYINAHGTGTALNDVAEAMAIEKVFGSHSPLVSSSKSQFGHCIGAAGAIEFAVCLSALNQKFVPPNITLETPDPKVGIRLASRRSLPLNLKCVMSNSFGFGGQNASLIVSNIEES